MKSSIKLAAAGILTLVGMQVQAGESSETTRVDPAELLRAVLANENKIHEVESLSLRIEGKWTSTPKRIAAQRFNELPPASKETLEFAFDRSRLRDLHDKHNASTILAIWDGRQTWTHTKFHTHDQESYLLDDSPQENFVHLQGLYWLRVGTHSFWWNSSRYQIGGVSFYVDRNHKYRSIPWGTPEDFVLSGRQVFRGRDCYVLDSIKREHRPRRLYVDTGDRLLYGETHFRSPPTAARQGIMSRIAKAAIKDGAAWKAWKEKLPSAEREDVERRYAKELFQVATPSVEWHFDDYREVSPGFLVPMKFGYTFLERDAEGVYAKSRRELRVVEAKVNTALPDEMFVMELREGVKVCDKRRDPPLFYTFKKKFSRQEWQTILDEQKKRAARLADIQAKRDGRPCEQNRPASTRPSKK